MPDDRVGDWVDKANTVTDKFDKAETVVKGGYDAYEWFEPLKPGVENAQTNGQVNEGIYDIIRKCTNEIIMTPFEKEPRILPERAELRWRKGLAERLIQAKWLLRLIRTQASLTRQSRVWCPRPCGKTVADKKSE